MSRKWLFILLLFFLAGVSFFGLHLVIVEMDKVPEGYSAPLNPSGAGIFQLVLAGLSAMGFTTSGVVLALMNLWKQWHPTSNVTLPDEKTINDLGSALPDLIQAFPIWIADRGNAAKSRRFWMDVIDVGIALERDPDVKAWLLAGAPILTKKYFPDPSPASALRPENVAT